MNHSGPGYSGAFCSSTIHQPTLPYGLMFRCSTRFGYVDVKAASVPSPDDCATTSKRVRHHRVLSSPHDRPDKIAYPLLFRDQGSEVQILSPTNVSNSGVG